MAEYYVGQVILSGFTFPPQGFMTCNGQVLNIGQYPALFSLLGPQFGGDGRTTFALPDMRGRTVVGCGIASSSVYSVGQTAGMASVTLNSTQVPIHTHSVSASTAVGSVAASGKILAASSQGNAYFGPPGTAGTMVSLRNVNGVAGGGSAHSNMQPYQVQNFIIATTGVYPQRP